MRKFLSSTCVTYFKTSKLLYSTEQIAKKIKLTLYTKDNCSLCDEAKEIIEETYPLKFEIEDVDITKNRELFRKFKLDIPVFYYNGQFLMKHRVDHQALKSLILK